MSQLVYFEIQADDPEATTAFYAAVLRGSVEVNATTATSRMTMSIGLKSNYNLLQN